MAVGVPFHTGVSHANPYVLLSVGPLYIRVSETARELAEANAQVNSIAGADRLPRALSEGMCVCV